MEKKQLTTQIDAMLSVVRESLNSARKEAFKFYIKTVKPKFFEWFRNLKHSAEHSDLESKLKKNSIVQNLSISRFILWLGIAASITGVLILFSPSLFVGWQLVLVLLIAILGPWILDFFRESSEEAKDTLEDYVGRQFIGKVHKLKTPMVNGESDIEVSGELWVLKGDNYPKGTRVKIIAVSEKNLYVVGLK